ncbi:MAG TPA: hypothetical protein VFF84_00315 [Sphingobium sp.]|nr:hypothetical protein [Sphingobium sp.]
MRVIARSPVETDETRFFIYGDRLEQLCKTERRRKMVEPIGIEPMT